MVELMGQGQGVGTQQQEKGFKDLVKILAVFAKCVLRPTTSVSSLIKLKQPVPAGGGKIVPGTNDWSFLPDDQTFPKTFPYITGALFSRLTGGRCRRLVGTGDELICSGTIQFLFKSSTLMSHAHVTERHSNCEINGVFVFLAGLFGQPEFLSYMVIMVPSLLEYAALYCV